MSVAGKPPNRMVNRAIKPVQKVESRVSPGGGVATFGPTLRFPLQILQSLLSMIGIRFLFFFYSGTLYLFLVEFASGAVVRQHAKPIHLP